MKRFVRSVGPYFAYAVIAYFAVIALNDLSFRLGRSPSVQNANWIGEFDSTMQPVSGKLAVVLPDPLPRGQEFEFVADVYYNFWSLFLTGRTARAVFVGYVDPSGGAAAGGETHLQKSPPTFSFKLKGGTGFAQDIAYVATLGRGDSHIAGAYRVGRGADVGVIELTKR